MQELSIVASKRVVKRSYRLYKCYDQVLKHLLNSCCPQPPNQEGYPGLIPIFYQGVGYDYEGNQLRQKRSDLNSLHPCLIVAAIRFEQSGNGLIHENEYYDSAEHKVIVKLIL